MPTMMFKQCVKRLCGASAILTLGAGILLLATKVSAAVVGEVEFSRGVGMAYVEGHNPRTLGKGLPLNEGDHLMTSTGAIAIIKLQDGTRMTLRPNSELVIQQYRFTENAADNSMVLRLLEGGFRAITGQISKNAPDAAKVITQTSTISIRGTDFDARICAADCKAESARVPEKARLNMVQASAKLVNAQGDINALDSAGARRRLVGGASVYSGETVETGAAATTILAFHDDSRLTLGPTTRFRVDSYVFDEKNASKGRSFVSLLRGSMRAATGLIGKENKSNVGYTTPTATIGIRGTGLDLDCPVAQEDIKAGDGCSFFTWLGSIAVTQNGQTTPHVLDAGQGLFVSKTEVRPLNQSTLQNLQRPDGVTVDTKQLFSVGLLNDEREGLFVFVRDGHIEITTPIQTLHLGRGETGFAAANGETVRPLEQPRFMEFDSTPLPSSINPMLLTVLSENGIRAADLCK